MKSIVFVILGDTEGTIAEMSVGVLGDGTNTGIKLFEYDGFNRLTKYTDDDSVASYTYYADNLRAGKTVNGASKQFYWNGENLAGETTGTTVKTYSYDLLGVSAVNDGTAQTYFAKDTHNDIVAHLNGEGAITSSQYFDSFGNKDSVIAEDEFGYTGEYMDAESGLIYLRNRYYDPETGRFINEDPHWNTENMIYGDNQGNILARTEDDENKSSESVEKSFNNTIVANAQKVLGIGDTISNDNIPNIDSIKQSGNLYTFGMNNPVMYTDRSGEIAWTSIIIWGIKWVTKKIIVNIVLDYVFGDGTVYAPGYDE